MTTAIAVKPLEWRDNEAQSPVGHYRVQRLDDKWEPLRNGYYMLPKHGGVVKAFDTFDQAKAAAQADYESRILSALTPHGEEAAATPAPQTKVVGVKIDRERAAKAAVEANNAFGQWMPERWLHLFLDAYEGKSR